MVLVLVVHPERVIDPWKVAHPTLSSGHSRNVVPASIASVVEVVTPSITTGGSVLWIPTVPSPRYQANRARPTERSARTARTAVDDGSTLRRS